MTVFLGSNASGYETSNINDSDVTEEPSGVLGVDVQLPPNRQFNPLLQGGHWERYHTMLGWVITTDAEHTYLQSLYPSGVLPDLTDES